MQFHDPVSLNLSTCCYILGKKFIIWVLLAGWLLNSLEPSHYF
jgi:hypothetical protein